MVPLDEEPSDSDSRLVYVGNSDDVVTNPSNSNIKQINGNN